MSPSASTTASGDVSKTTRVHIPDITVGIGHEPLSADDAEAPAPLAEWQVTVRFTRVFRWWDDVTAHQELDPEDIEVCSWRDGWLPIDTLPMAHASRIRTGIRRWCEATYCDLRDEA